MTLNQIRNVVAIAERGSLRSAARLLGVTQPSITRSIRELEHELGVTLFERKATGMTLTVMGKALVRRGTSIQNEIRRVHSEIEQLKGNRVGSVSIGLSTASHIALLPRVIGPFEKRYPRVKLRISEGLFPTMERDLIDGVMDFYVGPLAGVGQPPELIIEQLFTNRRLVFARRGHPLAGAKSLRFVCVVSCEVGIRQLRTAHPDVPVFTASIDPEINDRAYIVPGLGDAGDRYFGTQ